jgi:hypothetical protein
VRRDPRIGSSRTGRAARDAPVGQWPNKQDVLRTCSYFARWREAREDGKSLLERALKKSGGCIPHPARARGEHEVSNRGGAEREEYGYQIRQGAKAMMQARRFRAANVTLPSTRMVCRTP